MAEHANPSAMRGRMHRAGGRHGAPDGRLRSHFAGMTTRFDQLDASLADIRRELRLLRTTIITIGVIPYAAALVLAIAWVISRIPF